MVKPVQGRRDKCEQISASSNPRLQFSSSSASLSNKQLWSGAPLVRGRRAAQLWFSSCCCFIFLMCCQSPPPPHRRDKWTSFATTPNDWLPLKCTRNPPTPPSKTHTHTPGQHTNQWFPRWRDRRPYRQRLANIKCEPRHSDGELFLWLDSFWKTAPEWWSLETQRLSSGAAGWTPLVVSDGCPRSPGGVAKFLHVMASQNSVGIWLGTPFQDVRQ